VNSGVIHVGSAQPLNSFTGTNHQAEGPVKKKLGDNGDELEQVQTGGIARPTPVRPQSVQPRLEPLQSVKMQDDGMHPYSSVRDLLKNVQAKIREK